MAEKTPLTRNKKCLQEAPPDGLTPKVMAQDERRSKRHAKTYAKILDAAARRALRLRHK